MTSQEPGHAPEFSDGNSGAPEHLSIQESVETGRTNTATPPASFPPHVGPESSADSGSPLLWNDLVYLVLFYVVAGELIGLLVAVAAAIAFHIPFSRLEDLSGAGASVAVVSQALLSIATLAFLYVVVRARSLAPFWRAVGWRPFRKVVSWGAIAARYAFLGVGLALVVSWASAYLDTGKTLPMEELFRNRQTVVLLMVLGVLVAPFVEETLFRGCLYPVIARRFGVRTGVVVTGILFGAAHAPQLWGGWGQIALLMCVGMVLTYIRARAGTVAASYLVHVSYNSVLFAGLIFATGGLQHFPTT